MFITMASLYFWVGWITQRERNPLVWRSDEPRQQQLWLIHALIFEILSSQQQLKAAAAACTLCNHILRFLSFTAWLQSTCTPLSWSAASRLCCHSEAQPGGSSVAQTSPADPALARNGKKMDNQSLGRAGRSFLLPGSTHMAKMNEKHWAKILQSFHKGNFLQKTPYYPAEIMLAHLSIVP